MSEFTHIDKSGTPSMVDVSAKKITQRTATARSIVILPSEIIAALKSSNFETKKGPVFQTAILAGTMAVKKTSDIIPLCHPLPLDKIKLDIALNAADEVQIDCTVKCTAKTGVEMEALTGCSAAALTIYDMCKAFSHDILIKETKLIAKTGGKSDYKIDS